MLARDPNERIVKMQCEQRPVFDIVDEIDCVRQLVYLIDLSAEGLDKEQDRDALRDICEVIDERLGDIDRRVRLFMPTAGTG
jgi:hypothetical protein